MRPVFRRLIPGGLLAVGVRGRRRGSGALGMDFVGGEWGMNLAEQDDEVLLRRLRSLLDATAPICEGCNQEVTGLEQLEAHRVGDGHMRTAAARRRYAEVSAAGQLPEEPWCGLCGSWCNADSYAGHLRGSRHRTAYQVHLKLWSLRFAIGRICEELHRRNVPLPDEAQQALPVVAVCPVCPGGEGSPVHAGGSAECAAAPEPAKACVPAEEAASDWAHASTAAAGAEPAVSGFSQGQGSPASTGGSLRQEIVSMRAEIANVVHAMSGLAGAVSSMTRSVQVVDVSLRDLRHEVEHREDLVDQTAERVQNVERMMRVSRNWQSQAEEAIKSIQKKV